MKKLTLGMIGTMFALNAFATNNLPLRVSGGASEVESSKYNTMLTDDYRRFDVRVNLDGLQYDGYDEVQFLPFSIKLTKTINLNDSSRNTESYDQELFAFAQTEVVRNLVVKTAILGLKEKNIGVDQLKESSFDLMDFDVSAVVGKVANTVDVVVSGKIALGATRSISLGDNNSLASPYIVNNDPDLDDIFAVKSWETRLGLKRGSWSIDTYSTSDKGGHDKEKNSMGGGRLANQFRDTSSGVEIKFTSKDKKYDCAAGIKKSSLKQNLTVTSTTTFSSDDEFNETYLSCNAKLY